MANERSAAPPPHRDLRAATGMSAPHQASPYEAGQGVVKKVELDTFLRRLAIGGPGGRPYAPLQPAHGQGRGSTGQTLPIPLDQYLVPAGPEHAEGGAPPAGRTADDEATRRVLAQLEQLAERYSAAYSAANEQVRTSVRTILDVLADMQAKMPQGSASFEAAGILMAAQERLEMVDREARRDFAPPPTIHPWDPATCE